MIEHLNCTPIQNIVNMMYLHYGDPDVYHGSMFLISGSALC